eukprot:gene15521-18435_t
MRKAAFGKAPEAKSEQRTVGDIVDALLQAGADLEARTTTMTTTFGMAAGMGAIDLCRVLKERGANVDVVNDEGDTPLLSAINTRDLAVVKYLTDEAGARIDYVAEHSDETPLQRAGFHESRAVLAHIIACGGRDRDETNTALHFAVSRNDIKATRMLLAADPKTINYNDVLGTTPIFLAVQASAWELMRVLLAAGARVDVRSKEDEDTLIHVAAFEASPEAIDELVAAGCDITWTNSVQETALHVASRGKNIAMIRHLVKKHNLPINTLNSAGETPLAIAVQNRRFNVAKELLELGADPNIPDNLFNFPIHSAASTGLPKTIQLLVDNGARINVHAKDGSTPASLAMANKNASSHSLLLTLAALQSSPTTTTTTVES